MQMSIFRSLLVTLLCIFCIAGVADALEVPALKGRVNDYAGMLSAEAAGRLEKKLAAFEKETTSQIVVLTVPSLEGDVIENFSISVAEAWKIGQKEKGNGVLLILAKQERKIRIEVGTGLQGVLPDITAGQIIRNVIAPDLRAGNVDKGITAGVKAIIDATKGEFKATDADRKAARKKKNPYGKFIALLVAATIITAIAGSHSGTAGAAAGALSTPAAAAVGLGSALWQLGLFTVAGAVAGFLISLLVRFANAGGGGGWGGGTIISSGGGGSSSDSESFSGGGGDFDGGGSSDNW